MSLNCKNCVFGKKVENSSHHMSCQRIQTRIQNVNEHGVKNGWFIFPINFDIIWAESCNGFIPKNWKELPIENKKTILGFEVFNSIEEEKVLPREKNFYEIDLSASFNNEIDEEHLDEDIESIIEAVSQNILKTTPEAFILQAVEAMCR